MRSFLTLVLVLGMAATAEARGRRNVVYSSGGLNAAKEIAKGMPPHIKREVEKEEFHSIEQRLFEETNKARVRNGLTPLEFDPKLQRTTRWHTIWMTNRRSMTHGSGVSENIAMGQPSAKAVLNVWMNSSGHRANILNPNHRRCGLSAYCTPEGTIYWCQQFCR